MLRASCDFKGCLEGIDQAHGNPRNYGGRGGGSGGSMKKILNCGETLKN
jgi:hypothetical protein